MRMLMALLVLGCIACIASAVTGVQSFYWSAHNGAVESSVTYWQGSLRWLALVYAAVFAITFYGIYGRFPLAWKLGFIVLYLNAVWFIFQAWLLLWPQPYGWVGATAVTVVTPFVALYWATWWRRQSGWFFGDGEQET